MSQRLSSVKKLIVSLGLDSPIASAYSRFGWSFLRRLLPAPAYYTFDQSREVRREGVKFVVYPRDLSQWIIFSNQRDRHVEAALDSLASNNNGIILDVGANCGHFSLVLASRIKDQNLNKKIFAFEPNPRIYKNLVSNLSLNPQLSNIVEIMNIGLGERNEMLQLQIPNRNTGAGSLVRNYNDEPHESYSIFIKTIDELFANSDTTVEFIKIDVEDFEFFVLQGAKNVLQRFNPAMYIEVGSGQLKQREIFLLLHSMGYEFYRQSGNKFLKCAIDLDHFKPIDELDNILALHSASGNITPKLKR